MSIIQLSINLPFLFYNGKLPEVALNLKTENRPHKRKHRIHKQKKNERRISRSLTVAILFAIVFISALSINSFLNHPSATQSVNVSSEPKAAIVDELSLTYPNQTFIEGTINTLRQVGYTVDYYPPENVTVESYRNLPTHNYGLVILRAHSGFIEGGQNSIFLFSSESYSAEKYIYEQLTDQIALTRPEVGGPAYFGINENFVRSSMKGTFRNAVIVMMGCNGLTYTTMAKAFREKGARVYVSWNGSVLAPFTDRTTTHLLQHFLTERMTLRESLRHTLREVGTDPSYNSLLIYYPIEAGTFTIQNIVGNLTTHNVDLALIVISQERKPRQYSSKELNSSLREQRS